MDIEAIVKKHLNAWRVSTVVSPESCIRAALTELAAEYDRKQALLLEAHCERVSSLQERIRQLEAERVPDYTGGDAELLRQRVATDVSRCVTNAYDHIQAEEYSDALSSLLEAREHIVLTQPTKEGE